MSFLDIAVGAPWGGKDGNGAVYVYYGQNNEPQRTHAGKTENNNNKFVSVWPGGEKESHPGVRKKVFPRFSWCSSWFILYFYPLALYITFYLKWFISKLVLPIFSMPVSFLKRHQKSSR